MLFLVACSGDNSNKDIAFSTVDIKSEIPINADKGAPKCIVDIHVKAAKGNNDVARKINAAIADALFNYPQLSVEAAADSFAHQYINNYRTELAPLYRDDRNDASKKPWYEYRYNITTDTDNDHDGTITYIINTEYYEGGAHGFKQKRVLNFDAHTGKQLTLADICVPGYQQPLADILQEKLIKETDAQDLKGLRDKGYLVAMEMYAPDNFILGSNKITFIYNAYEIAAYDKGMIELTLRYEEIENVLKKDFE